MRYIAPEGVEKSLNTAAEVAHAIRIGPLGADSLVLDEASGRCIRARDHAALRSLLAPDPQSVAPDSDPPADGLRNAAVVAWLVGLVVLPVGAVAVGADPEGVGSYWARMALGWGAACGIGLIFLRTRTSRSMLGLVVGVIVCLNSLAMVVVGSYAREHLRESARQLQALISRTQDSASQSAQAPPVAPAAPPRADAPPHPAGVPGPGPGPRAHTSTPASLDLQGVVPPPRPYDADPDTAPGAGNRRQCAGCGG